MLSYTEGVRDSCAWRHDVDFDVIFDILMSNWCEFSAKRFEVNVLDRNRTKGLLIEKCTGVGPYTVKYHVL